MKLFFIGAVLATVVSSEAHANKNQLEQESAFLHNFSSKNKIETPIKKDETKNQPSQAPVKVGIFGRLKNFVFGQSTQEEKPKVTPVTSTPAQPREPAEEQGWGDWAYTSISNISLSNIYTSFYDTFWGEAEESKESATTQSSQPQNPSEGSVFDDAWASVMDFFSTPPSPTPSRKLTLEDIQDLDTIRLPQAMADAIKTSQDDKILEAIESIDSVVSKKYKGAPENLLAARRKAKYATGMEDGWDQVRHLRHETKARGAQR